MKKLFLTLAIAVAGASVASAQGPRDNFGNEQLGTFDRVTKHGPYLTGKFWDNTFIGVAGGVNLYNYRYKGALKPKMTKRLAPAVEFNVGKWVTPTTGIRIGYNGMQLKAFNGLQRSAKDAQHKLKYMFFHGDLMLNLSNAIGGYRENRVWDLIPYVGAGYARAWNKGRQVNSHKLAATAGLLNTFQLGHRVDLTLEGRWMATDRLFDGIRNGSKFDQIMTVTAGLTFKFGRKGGFKRPVYVAPVDVSGYQARIKALEGNIAQGRSTIERLTRELEAAKQRPAQVIEKPAAPVAQATYFKIGRSEVSAVEKANLKKIADIIKASAGRKFHVTGYADKGTGTNSINQTLSEKRAHNVADILVKTYGVNRSQLVVSGKGGVDKHPSIPVLDRVVITE